MFNKRIIMIEGCDRTGKSTFISILTKKLIEKGKIPLVFHLIGPSKFQNLTFNNDDKSLIQLAKFDDEYTIFDQMLNQNKNLIIILDRTHFGDYVWSSYWNREGKYTNYAISKELANKHKNIFDQSLYIDYYISDSNILESRILESQEDINIFTINNKSIKENINLVYALYEKLKNVVINDFNISYESFNNINDLNNVENFANTLISKYI